jgi:hypothetical protein
MLRNAPHQHVVGAQKVRVRLPEIMVLVLVNYFKLLIMTNPLCLQPEAPNHSVDDYSSQNYKEEGVDELGLAFLTLQIQYSELK